MSSGSKHLWTLSELLAKREALTDEERQLKQELQLLDSEKDISPEVVTSRKLAIEPRLHEVRVELARLPEIELVVPRIEEQLSLQRDEYQQISDTIPSDGVVLFAKVKALFPVNLFITDERGFGPLMDAISNKTPLDQIGELLGPEIFCFSIAEVQGSDFSCLTRHKGDYHIFVDSPYQGRRTTNKITLTYVGYKVKGSLEITSVGFAVKTFSPVKNLQTGSSVIVQKEVVKEVIVRIPCKHCGSLNDHLLKRCEYCGAPIAN